MISRDSIETIKEKLNIVDVVSRHMPIKKIGKNYTGLCPFHNERTPSFTVNEERQFFKCFGCGEGGDLIDFYTKTQLLSFTQSVRDLAGMAGIDCEESKDKILPKQIRETLLEDRMIEFMSSEYRKTGVKMTYEDKQRAKLAEARHEGICKKHSVDHVKIINKSNSYDI